MLSNPVMTPRLNLKVWMVTLSAVLSLSQQVSHKVLAEGEREGESSVNKVTDDSSLKTPPKNISPKNIKAWDVKVKKGSTEVTLVEWGKDCGQAPKSQVLKSGRVYKWDGKFLTPHLILSSSREGSSGQSSQRVTQKNISNDLLFSPNLCVLVTQLPHLMEIKTRRRILCKSDPKHPHQARGDITLKGFKTPQSSGRVTHKFTYQWALKGSICSLKISSSWRLVPVHTTSKERPSVSVAVSSDSSPSSTSSPVSVSPKSTRASRSKTREKTQTRTKTKVKGQVRTKARSRDRNRDESQRAAPKNKEDNKMALSMIQSQYFSQNQPRNSSRAHSSTQAPLYVKPVQMIKEEHHLIPLWWRLLGGGFCVFSFWSIKRALG